METITAELDNRNFNIEDIPSAFRPVDGDDVVSREIAPSLKVFRNLLELINIREYLESIERARRARRASIESKSDSDSQLCFPEVDYPIDLPSSDGSRFRNLLSISEHCHVLRQSESQL